MRIHERDLAIPALRLYEPPLNDRMDIYLLRI
jgi:hypothetical protein